MDDCSGIGKKPQHIEMPSEGKNILQFKKHHKQMSVPYIIYTVFEALNIPVEGLACDPKQSNAKMIASQVPCSYCYCVVRSDGVSAQPGLYRGENAVDVFLNNLRDELKTIKDSMKNIASISMSPEDIQAFGIANKCHVCSEDLGRDKVRDHCHITDMSLA